MQPNETTPEDAKPGFDPNTPLGTFIVAATLCFVCSLIVSAAAVGLKPMQERNAKNKMMRNVLIAAGVWQDGKHRDSDIPELFKDIDVVLWTLPEKAGDTGSVNKDLKADAYDQAAAASTPGGSISIPLDDDVSGIKRREKVSKIYLVRDGSGKVSKIVLPVYGKGLWSTLYGFLALDATTQEARGITFYKHAETPGLGGEVDNPRWKSLWANTSSPLLVRDAQGHVVLHVTKPGNATKPNEVDGLSGATITSSGVEKTIHYWLGPHAFGPFLDKFAAGELALTP